MAGKSRFQPEGFEHVCRPVAGVWVKALCCPGDGALCGLDTGQQKAQQIGHKKKTVRRIQQFRARSGVLVELEHRIDVHDLVAGEVVECFRGNELRRLVRQTGSSRIAVMVRIAKKLAVFADQSVVHAPCVDADAVKSARRMCLLQASLDLVQEPEHVPIEMSAAGNRLIRKPVYLLHGDPPVGKPGEHCTSARCAEIERKDGGICLTHCISCSPGACP